MATSPAPAALRAAVRPLLRTVIRRPGRLYQPLYLGPVATPEQVEAEVQALAEAEGLPAYFVRDGQRLPPMAMSTRAVLVVSADVAADLLATYGAERFGAQQLVIHGARPAAALDHALREWVARGLAVDPAALARPTGHAWAMGPTLSRVTRDPGRLYNPVLLLGPARSLPFIADEAMLRLEAGGMAPVLTLGGPIAADDPAVARVGTQGAVILRLPQGMPPGDEGTALVAGIEQLLNRGVQVLIACEPALQADLAGRPETAVLLARGIALVVAEESSEPAAGVAARTQRMANPDVWPPVHELLLGAPVLHPEPARLMTGRSAGAAGQALPLPDAIQTFAMGKLSGRLAVFGPGHIGAIDFDRGTIAHAEYRGDPWTAEAFMTARAQRRSATDLPSHALEALMLERICAIGAWPDPQYTLFAGPASLVPPDERVMIPGGSVVLEIMRRIDEGPRRARRIGGMNMVWAREGDTAPAATRSPDVAALWDALDGTQTVEAIARTLGLLPDAALEAVALLEAEQALRRVSPDDLPLPHVTTPVHVVAEQLLTWGLLAEATLVLTDAERVGQLTAEGALLLAHLNAGTDPHAAAVGFRQAVNALLAAQGSSVAARQLLLDATLNVSLLEVRGRQAPAAATWHAVRQQLGAAARQLLRTPRHLAIAAELSLRAEDLENARRLVAALRATPAGEADALIARLTPLLEG